MLDQRPRVSSSPQYAFENVRTVPFVAVHVSSRWWSIWGQRPVPSAKCSVPACVPVSTSVVTAGGAARVDVVVVEDDVVELVDDESVTVGQMIDYMRRRLTMEDRPVRLSQMLRNARSERAVICMFLAVLELVRLQAILLRQERTFGDILMKKNADFDQVMNDTLAARDDWR